jgi:hypothetical protein
VQKLDEIFYRHQLGPFDLWCDLVLEFIIDFFVWMSIYAFKSFRVCLMKLGALTHAYRLIIVISSWCISPFISMEYPSFSWLISLNLKFTLLEISTATPVCFQGPLTW